MGGDKVLYKGPKGIIQFIQYKDFWRGRIDAFSKNSPNFINKVDENLWVEKWASVCKEKDIKYNFNQNRFIRELYSSVNEDDLKKLSEEFKEIITPYNDSAEEYNKKIAEPYIQERKSLLSKLLNKKF